MYFRIPEFIAVRLEGALPLGATTTDLALLVTERLRQEEVAAGIIEYGGSGVAAMTVPERATLANMAPEYGATAGFFPIDGQTIDYLSHTRSPAHAAFVRAYAEANSLFRAPGSPDPVYSRTITIELAAVRRSVAGPRRPQDRLDLPAVGADFRARLAKPLAEHGFAVAERSSGQPGQPGHGALAIAAITACTNTSNPAVMVTAGLLARNALAAGLAVPAWVKTSLAPGSRVVSRYLAELELLPALEGLGFHVVGYGCTTCGGKSGPLKPVMAEAIERDGLVAAAALSGNRNFEGRIHRQVRANYIMSPPLVVAFALAGRIDIDLETEPLGRRPDGATVMLSDLWPSAGEIDRHVRKTMDARLFRDVYDAPTPNRLWDGLDAPGGSRFAWDPASSYIVEHRSSGSRRRRRSAASRIGSLVRGHWLPSATRSPPITSRPAARSRATVPPAGTCSVLVSRSGRSTPMWAGVAITRSWRGPRSPICGSRTCWCRTGREASRVCCAPARGHGNHTVHAGPDADRPGDRPHPARHRPCSARGPGAHQPIVAAVTRSFGAVRLRGERY